MRIYVAKKKGNNKEYIVLNTDFGVQGIEYADSAEQVEVVARAYGHDRRDPPKVMVVLTEEDIALAASALGLALVKARKPKKKPDLVLDAQGFAVVG